MEQGQLRARFIAAYVAWINEKDWGRREIAWIEYCTARDNYLGIKNHWMTLALLKKEHDN